LTIRSIVAIDTNAQGFVEQPGAQEATGVSVPPKPLLLSDCRSVARGILEEQLSRLQDPEAKLIGEPVIKPLDYANRVLSVEAQYTSVGKFTAEQTYEIGNIISAATNWDTRLSLQRVEERRLGSPEAAPPGGPGSGESPEEPPGIGTDPRGGSG
jgi:hypothetical protein